MMMVMITRGAADTECCNVLKDVLWGWRLVIQSVYTHTSLLFLFLLIDLELVIWVVAVIVLTLSNILFSFSEINPSKEA